MAHTTITRGKLARLAIAEFLTLECTTRECKGLVCVCLFFFPTLLFQEKSRARPQHVDDSCWPPGMEVFVKNLPRSRQL